MASTVCTTAAPIAEPRRVPGLARLEVSDLIHPSKRDALLGVHHHTRQVQIDSDGCVEWQRVHIHEVVPEKVIVDERLVQVSLVVPIHVEPDVGIHP